MPGSGKSAIGRKLAKSIEYGFLDTDYLIKDVANMGLQKIITQYGENKFLDIEEQAILNTKLNEYVIATGGSVVLSTSAMMHLKNNSFTIFLDLPYLELLKRLSMSRNIYNRGIVWQGPKIIRELYKMRLSLYEKYSDLTINMENKSGDEIIKDILKSFEI